MKDIKDSIIYILNIYIFNNDDINYEFESQIILKKIINLELILMKEIISNLNFLIILNFLI